MVVPSIFTADIPVVQTKEFMVSQRPYNDKAIFLILRYMLLSPNGFTCPSTV